MNDELIQTYHYYDDAVGWSIGGTAEQCAQMLVMYIAELKDGEECECCVMRHDMTQAEIDSAPVV